MRAGRPTAPADVWAWNSRKDQENLQEVASPPPANSVAFSALVGSLAVGQLPASIPVVGPVTASGTGGVGYATGAGGTVTQLTDKSTTVILDKHCGTITMDAAALNAGVLVSFTVTNSKVSATDVVHVQHDSAGTLGAYLVQAHSPGAGSFVISVRNVTAGNLSEAIVLRFAVFEAVAA